jgi:hypothetical protein
MQASLFKTETWAAIEEWLLNEKLATLYALAQPHGIESTNMLRGRVAAFDDLLALQQRAEAEPVEPVTNYE